MLLAQYLNNFEQFCFSSFMAPQLQRQHCRGSSCHRRRKFGRQNSRRHLQGEQTMTILCYGIAPTTVDDLFRNLTIHCDVLHSMASLKLILLS